MEVSSASAAQSDSLGKEEHSISWSEIKIVQNLIERCLQQYMTQTEIITALQVQANIEPGFTCLVWQKLEEQNPDFFYAYNIRLRIRDQIVAFNYLVDQQMQLLQKMRNSDEVAEVNGLSTSMESEENAEDHFPATTKSADLAMDSSLLQTPTSTASPTFFSLS